VSRLGLGGRFVAGKEWKGEVCGVGNNGAISGAVLGTGILHRCLVSGATPSGGADQASGRSIPNIVPEIPIGSFSAKNLSVEIRSDDSTLASGQDNPLLRGCPVQGLPHLQLS
jgi:hypothetical protein